jgi:hypothetical protein
MPPANDEESENDPLVSDASDIQLVWPTFGDCEDEYTSFIEREFLSLI